MERIAILCFVAFCAESSKRVHSESDFLRRVVAATAVAPPSTEPPEHSSSEQVAQLDSVAEWETYDLMQLIGSDLTIGVIPSLLFFPFGNLADGQVAVASSSGKLEHSLNDGLYNDLDNPLVEKWRQALSVFLVAVEATWFQLDMSQRNFVYSHLKLYREFDASDSSILAHPFVALLLEETVDLAPIRARLTAGGAGRDKIQSDIATLIMHSLLNECDFVKNIVPSLTPFLVSFFTSCATQQAAQGVYVISDYLRMSLIIPPHEFPIIKLELDQDVSSSEGLYALSQLSKLDFVNPQSPEITFTNSDAAGLGPRTEWVVKMLSWSFDNLFEFSDDRNVFIKPKESLLLHEYVQVGRLMGMALRESVSLGLSLTLGSLCILRNATCSEEQTRIWWKAEDPVHYANVLKLRMNFVDDLTFPNSDRALSNIDQLDEFITATGKWKVIDSIRAPVEAIRMGIFDVLPLNFFASFNSENQLQNFLQGTVGIDVMDLASSAVYSGNGEGLFDIEIGWFWEILDKFSQAELGLFLQFVSGSSFPPIGGFKNEWLRVVSDATIATNGFPQSQTCFHQLNIPEYTTKRNMRKRLQAAIGYDLGIDRM